MIYKNLQKIKNGIITKIYFILCSLSTDEFCSIFLNNITN